MTLKSISLIPIIYLLLSCDTTGKQPMNSAENDESKETAVDESSRLEQLKTEASRLRGGGSVKEVMLKGENVTIRYVSNFKEYQQINPQSSLTEDNLKSYWSIGSAIEKALIDGPVRIMKKFDFVKKVTIILPFEKTTYQLSVSKSDLEKFIGKDFKLMEDNWDKTFIDPYVYNENGRKQFLKEFKLSTSK